RKTPLRHGLCRDTSPQGEAKCACGVAGNTAAFQAVIAGSIPVTRSTAGLDKPAGPPFLLKRPGERSDGVCAERRGSFPALPLRGQGTNGINNAVPWTAIF